MAKRKQSDEQPTTGIRAWIAQQPKEELVRLRAAQSQLVKAWQRHETTRITWWHEVGACVRRFFPEGTRQYGANVAKLLAQELTGNEHAEIAPVSNALWQARIIATNLDEQEAREWESKRNSKGRPLSAYHVHCLVPIADKAERDTLLEKCLTESWSVQRLRAEVQNTFGEKRSRGGRTAKPRKAPSAIVALQEIQLAARHWQANHRVWFAGKGAALRDVSKRARTAHFYKELATSVEAMRRVQEIVQAELDALEGFGEG